MLFCFLTIGLFSFGQTAKVNELADLIKSRKFEQAINKTLEYLNEEPQNIDYKLILGEAYTDTFEYQKAIPYLEFTIENDKENSWRKGWALGYLGTCYFMLSEYDKSQRAIDSCLKLKATKNSSWYARQKKVLFGYGKYFKGWKIRESEHFRFHFQELPDAETKLFIDKRESAYKKINEFFNSKLPKKIDFFVWNSRTKARKILHRHLGFANPTYCIVHSYYHQTIGHEMTHVISYYSTNVTKITGLINEGTAVYFNLSNNNPVQYIKDWVKKNNRKINIKDIWINWKSYPTEFSYPLSGLFVAELIDKFGKEQFLEFFKDQTYENAKKVFGDKLDNIIEDFEKKLNQ